MDHKKKINDLDEQALLTGFTRKDYLRIKRYLGKLDKDYYHLYMQIIDMKK